MKHLTLWTIVIAALLSTTTGQTSERYIVAYQSKYNIGENYKLINQFSPNETKVARMRLSELQMLPSSSVLAAVGEHEQIVKLDQRAPDYEPDVDSYQFEVTTGDLISFTIEKLNQFDLSDFTVFVFYADTFEPIFPTQAERERLDNEFLQELSLNRFAPRDGTIIIRVHAWPATYGVETRLRIFPANGPLRRVYEVEPNDAVEDAMPVAPGEEIIGTFTSAEIQNHTFDELQHFIDDVGADVVDLPVDEMEPVVIAYMDTGIDKDHPIFTDHIYFTKLGLYGSRSDRVGIWPIDDNGHGTATAGVTASMVGDAPIGIMEFRAFSRDGFADVRSLLDAFEEIMKFKQDGAPIRVANYSWGGDDPRLKAILTPPIQALSKLGIYQIASAGNFGQNTLEDPHYPSSIKAPGLYAVAATDRREELAFFSNYGKDVKLAAPGVNIFSSAPGNAYQVLGGTSFSAPITATTIGLYLSLHPDTTYQQMNRALLNTSDRLGFLKGKVKFGMIDAGELLGQ